MAAFQHHTANQQYAFYGTHPFYRNSVYPQFASYNQFNNPSQQPTMATGGETSRDYTFEGQNTLPTPPTSFFEDSLAQSGYLGDMLIPNPLRHIPRPSPFGYPFRLLDPSQAAPPAVQAPTILENYVDTTGLTPVDYNDIATAKVDYVRSPESMDSNWSGPVTPGLEMMESKPSLNTNMYFKDPHSGEHAMINYIPRANYGATFRNQMHHGLPTGLGLRQTISALDLAGHVRTPQQPLPDFQFGNFQFGNLTHRLPLSMSGSVNPQFIQPSSPSSTHESGNLQPADDESAHDESINDSVDEPSVQDTSMDNSDSDDSDYAHSMTTVSRKSSPSARSHHSRRSHSSLRPRLSEDVAMEELIERRRREKLLLDLRAKGLSYKQIKERGRFTEAESTLRGRVRVLTKDKSQRVRNPVWMPEDEKLLCKAVDRLSGYEEKNGNKRGPFRTPWMKVSKWLTGNGGTYAFGAAACSKKYEELRRSGRDT